MFLVQKIIFHNGKKIHEKYDVSYKAINQTLTNILDFEYKLPAAEEEVTDELEIINIF